MSVGHRASANLRLASGGSPLEGCDRYITFIAWQSAHGRVSEAWPRYGGGAAKMRLRYVGSARPRCGRSVVHRLPVRSLDDDESDAHHHEVGEGDEAVQEGRAEDTVGQPHLPRGESLSSGGVPRGAGRR